MKVTSDHWLAGILRPARDAVQSFTLPAPRLITKPLLYVFLGGRAVFHYLYRLLVCEPLFKAYCKEYGKGVRTGVYTPWIRGPGDIVVGDDVRLAGAYSIYFGARFAKNPTLQIGSHTEIGHQCSFIIGKQITIGRNCLLAAGVFLFDSPGHPLNPADRLAGEPCPPEAVKPITIGDNVWIGRQCTIYPGVTIGDGAVVGAGSVVMSDVSPNTLVAGNPARRSTYVDLTKVTPEFSRRARNAEESAERG